MKFFIAILLLYMSFVANAQLTDESELGIASANGNTKTQSTNFKQLNDYKWEKNVLTFKGRYLNAKANGSETARYLMGGLRYEKELAEKQGIFLGEAYESDKFANLEARYFTDLGWRYRFLDSDKTKLLTELGYRYMHEKHFDQTYVYSNYGRVYGEWEHKWNDNFSSKYWLEYLPNISDNKDWQTNTELSITATLTKILAIKAGILLRYDHFPAPGVAYNTDTLFTTALVAKF